MKFNETSSNGLGDMERTLIEVNHITLNCDLEVV